MTSEEKKETLKYLKARIKKQYKNIPNKNKLKEKKND